MPEGSIAVPVSTIEPATVHANQVPVESALGQPVRAAPGFFRRLLRDRGALISLVVLVVVALISIFAPVFAPYDPDTPDFMAIRQAPSAEHWFGTDAVGRDVLSRVIYGGRMSLAVAVVAVLISGTIGLTIGSLSGFFGGWIDAILQRITEVFLAFPSLLLIITVAAALGPSVRNVMIIIGVFGWVTLSRLMRVEILSLREREFMLAARTTGASMPRQIIRHLLPNASGPLIVNVIFGLRGAILAEAGLSFLGVGVPPPTASWGNMINIANSLTYLEALPWAWIPPTLLLVVVVIAFSFLGDAIARVTRS